MKLFRVEFLITTPDSSMLDRNDVLASDHEEAELKMLKHLNTVYGDYKKTLHWKFAVLDSTEVKGGSHE